MIRSPPEWSGGNNALHMTKSLPNSLVPADAAIQAIGEVIAANHSFILLSHVRPDGDAIGSQLALAHSLVAMGKSVRVINEDGLPDGLAFLSGSEMVESPPAEPIEAGVVIALDTGNQPRLGARALHAASHATVFVNIDHHVSNPGYGDVAWVDASCPATGEMVYQLLVQLGMPMPVATLEAIYTAVSTDTGSFQFPATTARTYRMAADLIERGLEIGPLNHSIYHDYPFRRIELTRALLATLERSADGAVAHWQLDAATRERLELTPDDSEGLIDLIRAIRGVQVAVFFEELPNDGRIRVSMRSKSADVNVCEIAQEFGGGGHVLAAGIRMAGPLEAAKALVLAAISARL